jgi:hypothetical protein
MDRAEHLDWAKQRALEYLDRGERNNAIASMASDLGKHSQLKFAAARFADYSLPLASGDFAGKLTLRKFIEEFT